MAVVEEAVYQVLLNVSPDFHHSILLMPYFLVTSLLFCILYIFLIGSVPVETLSFAIEYDYQIKSTLLVLVRCLLSS